jgi:glutaconate CoA-transferase, subunit A
VRDGDTVYAAGFTHLMPFAATHEMIRQERRDLTLARATPDLVYDQMVAAGCARKLIFSYAGNPGVGSLRLVRRAIERGEVEWEEYTHYGMVARLYAGAARLPFMHLRSNAGSDLPAANPLIRTVTCPYTGEELSTVPALRPDVAIVHAQRADAEGNAHIWGIVGEQKEVAFAAERVILTCEELVTAEQIASDPNRTLIPAMVVNAVVHEPWCCHPSHVQGYYDRDNSFYIEWDRISADDAATRAYLDEWVYGVPDRRAYVEKLGVARLQALVPPPTYGMPANFGLYS